MKRRLLKALPVLAMSLATLSGCGINKKSSSASTIETDCFVAPDQAGTLIANWKVGPIPVAFEKEAAATFDAGEIAVHTAAMDTWNQFFSASKGGSVFIYGDSSEPIYRTPPPPPPDPCPQRIVQGGSIIGRITVQKIGSGWTLGSTVIAVTSYCYDSATPFKSINGATLKFNHENYGSPGSGRPTPDWQTIALHEQGHLLGLDHSCEDGSSKAGMPACKGTDPSYAAAVLFPILFSGGHAVVRQTLQRNDQLRANCLYGI